MRTRILRSYEKFNDNQKDNPCAVSCRKKKKVVELRRNKTAACLSVAADKANIELQALEQEWNIHPEMWGPVAMGERSDSLLKGRTGMK